MSEERIDELEKELAEAKKERDSALAERLTMWSHTCIHHNDAERKKALSVCLVCLLRERDEAQKACTQLLAQCDQFRAACAAKDEAVTARNSQINELINCSAKLRYQNAKLEAEAGAMRVALEKIADKEGFVQGYHLSVSCAMRAEAAEALQQKGEK